jgi:hypothetical protein
MFNKQMASCDLQSKVKLAWANNWLHNGRAFAGVCSEK